MAWGALPASSVGGDPASRMHAALPGRVARWLYTLWYQDFTLRGVTVVQRLWCSPDATAIARNVCVNDWTDRW